MSQLDTTDEGVGKPAPAADDGAVKELTETIERQFADFDVRINVAVAQLEQQLRDSSAVMVHQADALARVIESAEVSVARLAHTSSQAAADRAEAVKPPVTPRGPDRRQMERRETEADPAASPDGRDQEPGPSPSAAERDSDEGPAWRDSPEARIAELTAKCDHLEAARAVAEAGNRAKSCFLAAMSREMRTPVDGVIRMIELLGQTDLDQEQKRYLRTASYSANALLSLLHSVLNLSNVEVGELDDRRADFDLRRTLEDAITMLTPSAKRKGLPLTCHVPGEVPTLVRGERGRLRQILLYATHRTIQLSKQGEVAVRAALEHATSTTTTVRFTVHHTGTALPGELMERAFATHAEIDGAPVGSDGGSGLGLAIARQLVELMGGKIGIMPDEIPGFTIWFTIPLDNYRRPADDRRAHGRLPQELLQCNLGSVLDLSMSGIRVRCTRPPKGIVDVELMDLEDPVNLKAQVMWIRRLGFRKFEVGLNFLDVPPDVARQLTRVSLNHRLRRLLGTA